MKYEIIKNEQLLDDFIAWLPDLKPHEKFYVALFARKKYDPLLQSTSSDKMQLKRFLATKENLKLKIKQLEIDYGLYKLKNTIATQQSLALYITPNPRCMKKAQNQLLINLATAITKGNVFHNLHAEALSCVQKSKSYSYVIDFDIDTKEIDLSKINEIPKESYNVLETRGGYHILIKPHLITQESINGFNKSQKHWYQAIMDTYSVDQAGDQMIPVPGTSQGGFIPKFII